MCGKAQTLGKNLHLPSLSLATLSVSFLAGHYPRTAAIKVTATFLLYFFSFSCQQKEMQIPEIRLNGFDNFKCSRKLNGGEKRKSAAQINKYIYENK